jgi:5,10-methylenetetrahydromethanopterin reductase
MTSPRPLSTPAGARRIGFAFWPDDVPSTLDLINRAEAAGIDTAWLVMPADAYDTPTIAAAALARTDRINVGTSIVPAFTRHPLSLATQALAVAELAPGRFRLGIGTGNLATMANGFGTPVAKPASRLREYATVVRDALTTGAVAFRGEFYQVDAKLPRAVPVDLVVAALGPRLFSIAGELADGAMSWMTPFDYLAETASAAVRDGADRGGRSVPPILAHVPVVAHPEPAVARAVGRRAAAAFAANAQYAQMFAAAGYPVLDGNPSDELIDALVVSGDEATLSDRLGALAESGHELVVTQETADDARAEQDLVLRVIGNVARTLG